MAKRVLVVDDSAAIRQSITYVLQQEGYEVIEAKDGQDGLDVLGTIDETDLIVTDVNMPNLDGIGFIRRVREQIKLKFVPSDMPDQYLTFDITNERYGGSSIIIAQIKYQHELVALGILADQVYEVVSIPEKDIEAQPPIRKSLKDTFVSGLAKVQNKFAVLFSLEKILSVIVNDPLLAK